MKQPINEIERFKLIAGLINEVEYNDTVHGVNRNTKTTLTEAKEEKALNIDVANPYEFRNGLQYELDQMNDYSDEALEKAKVKVLKNLTKDTNFYFNIKNEQPTGFEFKTPETDAPGMQANADGTLKKGAGKLEKANVQDSLGKKEEGTKKPKGVEEMSDKGVEGKEKVVKEGIDDKVEDMIKSGKIKPEEVKTAAEKAMKGDSTSLIALMAGIKLAEDQVEEAKKSNEIEWISSDFSPIEGIKVKKGDKGEIVNHDTGDQYLVKFNNHRFYANVKDFKEGKESVEESIDGGIMRKIKDFVGSKGFQFGVRRPSEEEDKVAADHFSDYENKKVNSIGVDKVTGNIYAANNDYEVVLSPEGKVLKSDTSITGKYNKDTLDAYQGELEKDADKYYKRQDIKNKLKSLVGYKPDEFGDYRFEGKEKMNEEFKYFDNYEEFENTLFQLYPQVKANPEKYKRETNSRVDYSDGYVNWGGWDPNRPNSPSGLPPGAVNMNNKMTQSDLIYPTGSRMDEDNMESDPTNGDSSAEGQFNQLMSKYDWYHEMSDDPRKWDTGSAMDQKLKSLAKTIGVDRAVELFNDKAPSDRKVTTTFFAEGKDKHAKLKETLKKGLKELITVGDIQAAKLTGKPINISKTNKQDIAALQNAKANFTTYE